MTWDEFEGFQPSTVGALTQNILIVEDKPDTGDYLQGLLEKHGFAVRVAKDGGQAHAYFAMYKPDLAIVDCILPGESGFEVCQRMKQEREYVPVLLMTVIDSESARILAGRVGADAYLTKPIRTKSLLQQIHLISQKIWKQERKPSQKSKGRITFQCECGKRYKVSLKRRGTLMTCTQCFKPLLVPRQG